VGKFANVRSRSIQTKRPLMSQFLNDCLDSFQLTSGWKDTFRSNHSYSQFGEDKVIRSLLPERFGSYLDIGAGHPVRNSNSYYLYKLGWHGTLIEPITELAQTIARKRPRDEVVNCLVATQNIKAENTKFFEFHPSELSTADKARAESLIQDGYELIGEYAITIRDISEFTKFVRPADPFLFTIDIEGLDYEVLKSIDWKNFQPRVVCVENPDWLNKENKIDTILRSNGYKLVSSHFISTIYACREY
jgi:FkbM family methyltransferase